MVASLNGCNIFLAGVSFANDICILGICCDSYLSLVAYLVLYYTAAFRFRTLDETPSFFVVGTLIDELSRYYLPTRYLYR